MPPPLRLGIAGLGTVGAELVAILQRHRALIERRAGRAITISAITARNRHKDRDVDLSAYAWCDDATALAQRDDIDVFVELIGGEDGPAKAACIAALETKKHIVSANKAMLAIHGQALAQLAEEKRCALNYEAAVAGGIPCIKALRESLAGNQITRVLGVMNGTCNYILTQMEDACLSYEEAFAQADSLGYLEADPNLDIGGIDAAHKLAILAALAFGAQVNFKGIYIQGINMVRANDIKAANEMGYRIKLLGVAKRTGDGLSQTMRPCLVPKTSPLAQLDGGTNMIILEGDNIGQIALRGAGAGAGPTASAVLGDIIDIAKGGKHSAQAVFGQPADTLCTLAAQSNDIDAPYYLSFSLQDKPGVLAKITTLIAKSGISIDRMRQKSHADNAAPVIILTHPTRQSNINAAMGAVKQTQFCTDAPVCLRVEYV